MIAGTYHLITPGLSIRVYAVALWRSAAIRALPCGEPHKLTLMLILMETRAHNEIWREAQRSFLHQT